ncbi:MAG TPA: hypothetical protein V6D14_13745 [Coleofasciculaceae cyanobacterium]|jgi:hypothetical protein
MAHLIYPTIDLFLYDLRDGLGQEQKEIDKNRQHFAQKLPASIHSSLFEHDTPFEAEYIELLGNPRTVDLTLPSPNFEGYYYPVRLSDTYALLLDCSVKNQITHPVSCIATLKKLIDQALKEQVANIGQTWMISGELPSNAYPIDNPESIAQACYQALIPDASWEDNLQGKGYFLGATIFELWRDSKVISDPYSSPSPEPLSLTTIKDNHHIIIAIYPNQETADKAADFIPEWLRLFCYRSKILWAYRQSRLLKQSLKTDFIKIQQYIKGFKTDKYKKQSLKHIEQILDEAETIFSNYVIDLNYLEFQSSTIDTNLYNYRQLLVEMQNNSTIEVMPTDLKFLKKFYRSGRDKYLQQVQKDYDSLSPGLKLLEVSVNFIRAEVALNQAKRDRTFQNTIAIIGVGLAAGSFIASIAGQFPGAGDTKPAEALKYPVGSTLSYLGVPNPWLVPTTSIVISLGVAIAAGAFTALVIQLSWLAKKLRSRSR